MPLGWLIASFTDAHEFAPEQTRFLSALADNAAIAVDNRFLFRSTTNTLRETMALYNATSAVSRARTLADLDAAVSNALTALEPDACAGFLMTDPVTGDITEMFNSAQDGAPLPFRELLRRHGLFREETILLEDVPGVGNPDGLVQDLQAWGNVVSFASVALRVQGLPHGRLFLAYHRRRRFTESDARYLSALVDSSSVVVDNIILLEQVQSSLEETSTLYRASRDLADAGTPEEVVQVATARVAGPHVQQVFLALLTTRNWNSPDAAVRVVSSWQRAGVTVDMSGVTLAREQFPAWAQLSTPTVLTIDDVDADPTLNELERMGVASLSARSVAIVPLRVPTRAIGALWIASDQPHHHTEAEVRIWQTFGEQASLALEAAFLLQQTERRARQLGTSAEVSQIATSILDLNQLLPRVVDLIQQSFDYDHVQIFLMDAEDTYAELRASTGEAGRKLLSINHKLQKGSVSVIGQVTAQGRPIIALDTSDARVIHRPNPYLPNTRSEMALPIVIKDRVVGALDVQSNQPNAFNEDDLAVLTALAAQLSVAIDNARLFESAESRANEMSFLFTITTAAASATNLEDGLRNVTELLQGSLGSLAVGIYLLEDADFGPGQQLRLTAAYGAMLEDDFDLRPIPVGQPDSAVGMVAQDMFPLTMDDVADEPRYRPLNSGARSAIVVPLTNGSDLNGVIAVEDERYGAYNQESLALMLALSGTLSAIVQNARLLNTVQRTNQQLRELDRLKSDFLANMSHELRTPLNSIIGFSRVMLKGIDGPLTDMQEQDLSTIYNSGQHLLGLINDILDQAKIAANKMDLNLDYFEVKPLIEGVRAIGIGLVKEKAVDLVVEMPSQLPRAYGDEFRTRQVLLNLVSNAVKFTNQGSVTIRVYPVTDETSGGTLVRVDVTDTGIGIAEKDMPLLFEAFRQVDSSLTRTVGGTGLGLPIARSLIEMQGGQMIVTSKVNVGSTFSVTIPTVPASGPLRRVEETLETAVVPPPAPTGNGIGTGPLDTQKVSTSALRARQQTVGDGSSGNGVRDTAELMPVTGQPDDTPPPARRPAVLSGPPPGLFLQKRQILLIEDNPDMVDQFRRTLQREGFEMFVASTPLEAEAMASGLRPTFIIMDVDFAGGAGWEILARIKDRDDTFDIPVVVVTLNQDAERAYRLGAYSVVQRPFMPEDLVKTALDAERDSNIDRILIIDDQPDDTRLLEEVLRESGQYRIFAAHTGPEGISLVARRRPNLIILDLRMPGMDGFRVLEELRTTPETATIPVMIVTSDTTLTSEERDRLSDIQILYKADLNQDNYQQFIDEVRDHIARYTGR